MPQFAESFTANGIDMELLPEITSHDLLEIGVARLADRKRIMSEIRSLSVEQARSSVQRRVLSVFFCDMVGSTARSTEIDPEELRSEMKLYQDTVVAAVNRHGGFVARFMGDGVLAYFGWPHADEDQASQALRAGLDAIRSVGRLEAEAGFPARCRIGIATGRVVVGGQQDLDSAFGETPNLAARLQGLADVDQIVIDSSTKRAVGNRFAIDYLCCAQLKGFDAPVHTWCVKQERKYVDRFESRGGGLSIFVGRERELEILRSSWQDASSGRGRAVIIRGDPGIGKSRLLKHFCEFELPAATQIQQYHCSAHHTNSAFYPVIQRFEEQAGIVEGRDGELERLEKITAVLHPSIAKDPLAVSLIADLFGLGAREDPLIAAMTAKERRSQMVEMLIRNATCKANGGALVFVLEDAHWIDPSSLEILEALMDNIERSPIFVLITCRPGARLQLPDSALFRELRLERLDQGSIEQLARDVDVQNILSADDIRNIVQRADGVPFFAEEIALAAIESGARGEAFELPETIEASLAARLDNLGTAKAAIQVASVIGREFRLGAFQSLAALDEATLLAGVGGAIAAGLVREVPSRGDRAFAFTHALVQDVAYNGLLKQQRRKLHKRLALEVLDSSVRQREPELVAFHLTRAGEADLAINCWRQAASQAAEASANAEAIAHYEQGLRLLPGLPASDYRDELEFSLLVGMALPLIVEKGYTSEQVEQCISRALAIGKKIKYTPDIYSLLFSQWGYQITFGLVEDSRRVAYEFSELAESQNDEVAKYARYRMLGATHMCLGELDQARAELSTLVDQYEPDEHAALSAVYGVDLRVAGRCFLSEVLWLMGHVDEARASAATALSEATALAHLHSQAISLHFCGLVSFLNRDREPVRNYMQEMMELAAVHPIGAWPTLGGSMLGWALLDDSNFDAQFAAVERGVAAARGLGVSMFVPFFYCRIAELLLTSGRFDDAAKYLHDADQLMNTTGETVFRGEYLQLSAQLRVREHQSEAAQNLFIQGLAHARSQNARSVELRVATAYARFLRERQCPQEARDTLDPVLEWFDPEIDNADLREARQLRLALAPAA